MDPSRQDASSSRPNQASEPELDLYTIPSYSGWFSWDEIHETERLALKEFFDGNSMTRTPRIYKEYRDFIINKYREEPSRRLTFTEVRKSLVGDVCMLHKVFLFLENWGLINFGAPGGDNLAAVEDGQSIRVRIEEGVPNGIRVGAMPNSVKPISAPPNIGDTAAVTEGGSKLPPLASYTDVFGNLMKQERVLCGNCGEHCGSGYYAHTKDQFLICDKCFKEGNYGQQKCKDDFKFNQCSENSITGGAIWSEEETLLLLESVLKHGDDWELVAQNVQSKSKLDCILKLIELPFGEFMSRSASQKGPSSMADGAKQVQLVSSKDHETVKSDDQSQETVNENGTAIDQGPTKRQRLTAAAQVGSSMMKQVALISTIVGPDVAAAAADGAVTALCNQYDCSKEIFDGQDDRKTNGLTSLNTNHEADREQGVEDSEMEEVPAQSGSEEMMLDKDGTPLILRVRAAIATGLGAAAAHAKVLADQEEREMEHLVAIIIETQMKKLQHKIKHFDDLEVMMEEEYSEMQELEDSILGERIDALQRAFSLGISRWKDYSSLRS